MWILDCRNSDVYMCTVYGLPQNHRLPPSTCRIADAFSLLIYTGPSWLPYSRAKYALVIKHKSIWTNMTYLMANLFQKEPAQCKHTDNTWEQNRINCLKLTNCSCDTIWTSLFSCTQSVAAYSLSRRRSTRAAKWRIKTFRESNLINLFDLR